MNVDDAKESLEALDLTAFLFAPGSRANFCWSESTRIQLPAWLFASVLWMEAAIPVTYS